MGLQPIHLARHWLECKIYDKLGLVGIFTAMPWIVAFTVSYIKKYIHIQQHQANILQKIGC